MVFARALKWLPTMATLGTPPRIAATLARITPGVQLPQ